MAATDRKYCVAVVTLTLLLIVALVSIIVLAVRLQKLSDGVGPRSSSTVGPPSSSTAGPRSSSTTTPAPAVGRPRYYGKEVGPLSRLAHGVSGVVYVVDAHRIRIRDLTYDGTAPEAFFWIGRKGIASDAIGPFGEPTPDENGSMTRLTRDYNGDDVILTLQPNITVSDLHWFALWCIQYQMNFGHVTFPNVLDVPRPQVIGQISVPSQSVRFRQITVLDHRTVLIEQFFFDPRITDVYFYAGNGSGPTASESLFIVPRVDGGFSPLVPETLRNVNITLTFPNETFTLLNVDFLTLYSRESELEYGTTMLPRYLNVPPHIPAGPV